MLLSTLETLSLPSSLHEFGTARKVLFHTCIEQFSLRLSIDITGRLIYKSTDALHDGRIRKKQINEKKSRVSR